MTCYNVTASTSCGTTELTRSAPTNKNNTASKTRIYLMTWLMTMGSGGKRRLVRRWGISENFRRGQSKICNQEMIKSVRYEPLYTDAKMCCLTGLASYLPETEVFFWNCRGLNKPNISCQYCKTDSSYCSCFPNKITFPSALTLFMQLQCDLRHIPAGSTCHSWCTPCHGSPAACWSWHTAREPGWCRSESECECRAGEPGEGPA